MVPLRGLPVVCDLLGGFFSLGNDVSFSFGVGSSLRRSIPVGFACATRQTVS